MNRVDRTALVSYSCEQMYQLVNDIEKYPEFMPGCSGAELLERGDTWLKGRLTLSKGGIEQSFVTKNVLAPPESMSLTLEEGPFDVFQGQWRFVKLDDNACKIEFFLEFEFSNKLLGMAVGKFLEQVASQQVDAVCQRAKKVYG